MSIAKPPVVTIKVALPNSYTVDSQLAKIGQITKAIRDVNGVGAVASITLTNRSV